MVFPTGPTEGSQDFLRQNPCIPGRGDLCKNYPEDVENLSWEVPKVFYVAVFLAFESIEHLEDQQSKDPKSGGKTESEYNLRIETF